MFRNVFGFKEDATLVREVVAGSHEALAALYDRHGAGVFAVARRLTRDRQLAEEVAQEVFLALWNRAELFDPQQGSLAAWLRTIARHRTVDRLRQAGRRPRLVAASEAAIEDESDAAALDRLARSGARVGGGDPPPDPQAVVLSG